jgi:hypothetical protein
MSESFVTILNPLKFMNKLYIQERLKVLGYGDICKIKLITHNEMPMEIELNFVMPELAEKFLNTMNGQSLDEQIKHQLNLKPGKSDKTNTLSSTKEAKYYEDYTKWPETLYERKPKEEGLILTDALQIENQKKIMSYLIKKIGKNMLKGQSIMNVSLPVYIFDKRSMLQIFAYELKEAPYLLSKVYYIQNNIEKLKLMTVFLLSQIVLTPILLKPFNPIIGETFQAKIGNLNVYLEQTVHKPPTANFYCFDDDGLYKIYGYIAVTANAGVNCFTSKKLGNVIVEFKNGYKYKIYYPMIIAGGTTMGKKFFNVSNCALIIDLNNQICSYIKFNPDKVGLFQGLFAKKKDIIYYPDKFIGQIINLSDVAIDKNGSNHELKKDAKSYSIFGGEWTQEIFFGKQIYWKRNLDNYCNIYEMDYKLPSDSSFREDVKFLGENDEEKSQIKKELYEEIQRNDTRLRNKYKPK